MSPTKFQLNPTYHSGADVFLYFQDGHRGIHLRYRNGTILAIINLHVAPRPSAKFGLNLTGFRNRCGLKIFKKSPWQPSWISERNDFSNSESLCPFHASHQVSTQSDLRFGKRCHLENFKMAFVRLSWIPGRNDFSNSESMSLLCLHQISIKSNTVWKKKSFEEFQDGRGGHLSYRNGTILAILNLFAAPMHPIKLLRNRIYGLGGDVV